MKKASAFISAFIFLFGQVETLEAVSPELKKKMDDLIQATSQFEWAKDLSTKIVTSSNPVVATADANLSAIPQNFSIRVDSLATNESWAAPFSSLYDEVTYWDANLEIQYRGVLHTISVPARTQLFQLAEIINSKGYNFSASTFDTNDGSQKSARLILSDKFSGASKERFNISIRSSLSGLSTFDFGTEPTVAAKNATIILNGDIRNPISSYANFVTDIIPGVSVRLLSKPTQDQIIEFAVFSETGNGVGLIKNFIQTYNALYEQLQTEFTQTHDAKFLIFKSDLAYAVSNIVPYLPCESSVRSIVDLGIQSRWSIDDPSKNGELILNEYLLNESLEWHLEDTIRFFEGEKNEQGFILYRGFAYQFGWELDRLKNRYIGFYWKSN